MGDARKKKDPARKQYCETRAFSSAGVSPALLGLIEGPPSRRRDAGATKPRRERSFNLGSRSEVVAIPGKQGQARTLHADLDAVIHLRTIGPGAGVRKRVLIAGLLGNTGIEGFEIVAGRSVKNISAGRVGVFREDITSEDSGPTVDNCLAESYGVDGDAHREQQLESLVVTVRVVFRILPVGDHENNLAPVAPPVAQLVRRGVNGVVNVLMVGAAPSLRDCRKLRRAGLRRRINARPFRHYRRSDSGKRTAEIYALELRNQRIVAGNELRDGFRNFVKAPQRHLVGRAESSRDSLEGFLDLVRRTLLQVIVDQDGSRQGKGIHREQRNLLLNSIFKHSEIILLEVGDQLPGAILDGDGHNHKGYGRANSSPWILGL